MIDADGSTAPEEIPAFVRALTDGADFAKGSRFSPAAGRPTCPSTGSSGTWRFVHLVRLFFGGHYTDLCYGYNAFWTRIVPMLELDA